jgi:hypothetical protein
MAALLNCANATAANVTIYPPANAAAGSGFLYFASGSTQSLYAVPVFSDPAVISALDRQATALEAIKTKLDALDRQAAALEAIAAKMDAITTALATPPPAAAATSPASPLPHPVSINCGYGSNYPFISGPIGGVYSYGTSGTSATIMAQYDAFTGTRLMGNSACTSHL